MDRTTSGPPRTLVVGAGGVAGDGIARELAARGDGPVFCLSRRGTTPAAAPGDLRGLPCDLGDKDAVATALRVAAPTCVVYAAHVHPQANAADIHPRTGQALIRMAKPWSAAWRAFPPLASVVAAAVSKRAGLVDHGENARMFRNLLEVLAGAAGATVRHLAVVTGGRLYGVHLGPALHPAWPTSLAEDTPRHPGPSWYFDVEDDALAADAQGRFRVSIHRPHYILGAVRGAPYSLVNALGVYAALLQHAGRSLIFPGGRRAFAAQSDAVSAEQLGAQIAWAARTPAAWGQALNASNGAPLRWDEVWPALAEAFGMKADVPAQAVHLHELVADPPATWASLRAAAGMAPMALELAFPKAFLHQSMVVTWDLRYDLSKIRGLGFAERRDTPREIVRLIGRLRSDGTLPPR